MYDYSTGHRKRVIEICEGTKYEHRDNTYIDWSLAVELLNKEFGTNEAKETWRSRYRNNVDRFEEEELSIPIKNNKKNWKDYLITLTAEEHGRMTDSMLIKKMGFNPRTWQIKNIIANKWWTDTSKDGDTLFHGQLKVNMIPISQGFDFEWFEEHLKTVQPTLIDIEEQNSETMLFNQFNDMHFGTMTFDDYYETLQNSLRVITKRHRDKTYYIIGGDLIHNNDLKGHTANLTPIEQVDMGKAIEDAVAFFTALISKSLEHSNEVALSWNKGNHDEIVSMMIARELRALFPQCLIDLSDEYYKLINYGNNAIGYTHGDKISRNRKETVLHNAYLEMFPDNFTVKHSRFIFTEHYHTQELVDEWGTHVYTLATKKKTDRWHKEKLFIGKKRQFTLFEFDKERMIKEHRV